MPLSPLDHAVIGGMSGTIEVLMLQPTIALKNAFQEGRKLPLSPAHLYRGVGMSVASMAPITATQFGSNFAYNKAHHALTGRAGMTQSEKLTTGFLAGATSALLANPTELVVIKQQQSGRSLAAEVADTVRRLGVSGMAVGVTSTALREGIYGCCWMEVMPIARHFFSNNRTVQEQLPAGSAHILSGVTTGILAAILSHPWDTIKTRMQAYIEPTHPKHDKYTTVPQAIRSILRDDGFMAFYSGVAPRMFRICCAVFILTACRAEISPRYEQVKDSIFVPR